MDNKDFLEIVDSIRALSLKLDEHLKNAIPVEEPYESKEVDKLYAALANAQPKLPPIKNTKMNPWFDSPYADIFEIARKVYPVLGPEGLSIKQPKRVTSDGATILYTRLCHSSGQWTESRLRVIPPKNDIDSFRSTLNALRATEILSILGIGVSNDPLDDDGEIAMIEARSGLAKVPTSKDVETKKQDAEVITKEQRQELEYEMGDHTDLASEMMDRCHVRSLADIPKSQFRNAITFIRKNVQAREGKDIK